MKKVVFPFGGDEICRHLTEEWSEKGFSSEFYDGFQSYTPVQMPPSDES